MWPGVGTAAKYPWLGDPSFSDCWIADSQYLDSVGSVGDWTPCKGSIHLTQGTGANKPTYSAAWGSSNKGMLTFDGVNDHLIGEALAAKVTGMQSFTIITAWAFTSVSQSKDVWRFSAASDNTSTLGFQSDPSTPAKLRLPSLDDSGDILVSVNPTNASTSRLVHTGFCASTGPGNVWTYTERLDGSVVSTGQLLVGSAYTNLTVTKFTVGAFRGVTQSQFAAMKLRALLFAPLILSASSYQSAEQYLISEKT